LAEPFGLLGRKGAGSHKFMGLLMENYGISYEFANWNNIMVARKEKPMKKLGMNVSVLLLTISFLLFGSYPASAGDPYADAVVDVNGYFGHCCSDLSFDPGVAAPLVLGPPDASPTTTQNFIQLKDGSSITLAFVDNVALSDGSTSGADLRIHTYDEPYPSAAIIEVSADGIH
jgi:hypothetical protein